MAKTARKKIQRQKRHWRIRNRLHGTPEKPRLAVYRSNKNISAQIIDDESGKTLISVSTVGISGNTGNAEIAEKLGTELAEKAKKAGISKVAFDRGGFKFHGRVKALAEAARSGGLDF